MSRKVLIVDDEQGIRQALGQLLEFEGYEVRSADNATDGVTTYQSWRPHLVFNGHLHVRAVTREESTLQLSFAALVEAPYEIATVRVEIDGDAVNVSYECASLHAVEEEKVPVLDPAKGELRCE